MELIEWCPYWLTEQVRACPLPSYLFDFDTFHLLFLQHVFYSLARDIALVFARHYESALLNCEEVLVEADKHRWLSWGNSWMRQ